MKKAIFIFSALLMLVSGVAAVSAYEAHLINVKAHVENALTVNTDEIDFGTVFPQEVLWEHRSIALSESAITELEDNLISVSYQVWAEWKPIPDGVQAEPVVTGSDNNSYFAWLGDWLWVGLDTFDGDVDDMAWVGPAPAGPPGAQQVDALEGTLDDGNLSDRLDVVLLAPVFEGYYNELTDVKPDWWPFDQWQPIAEDDDRYIPEGVDLGLDLKIQVVDITRGVVIQ